MLFKKVYCAVDGKEAYRIYEEEKPNIILTDIKMPEMDGLRLVEKIRQTDYDTAIVLLTSFTEKEILMDAANLSVDGYIVKPINLKNLVETLSKGIKRGKKIHELLEFENDCFYNTATKDFYQKGMPVSLSVKELELIELLISNYPRTVNKTEISEALWPYEASCESAIKNLILRIRKKIDSDIISSVRGVGYRIIGLVGKE